MMKKQIVFVLLIFSAGFAFAQPAKLKDTLVNNAFINRILNKDLTYENIKKAYSNTRQQKKSSPNMHDAKLIDTSITLFGNGDTFKFIKNRYKTICLSATIKSPNITFDKNISIGMQKADFKTKFGLKQVGDSFIIMDLEGGSIVTAFFNNANQLIKIKYQADMTFD